MKRNYFLSLFITLAFFTTQYGIAQNVANSKSIQQTIEGLSIYPNPVNSLKTYIYITSKLNSNKYVEFYNVLGKQIFTTRLTGKELNISNLDKGVYILKITENNVSETRKLVIK
ncbi:T9SS type A sorting domain-containing protein [Flaviramulus aquimarinus]|uniref:T9SS type A sorting domain-containing protein n=1 Tax=Flaviramulus aquimarinus TaxID=1170456 RepID=A0ABP9EYN9_9FLAO